MDSRFIKPWILKVKEYVPGRKVAGCVKLASNENNFGPSPRVREALASALDEVNTYPYRGEDLREKIASYCGFSAENIVLGNGSDELIDLIMKVFRGPVLAFSPTFSCYGINAAILGEEYFEVRLDSSFKLPLQEFLEKANDANLIFLCNPNNPDGGVLSESAIKAVLDLGKTTVVDEAYFEFYGRSAAGLIAEYDNLVVMRTFAKAFGLAGLRVGYAIACSDIIALLSKAKPPFNVNTLGQIAALAALEDIPYMESVVEKTRQERKRVSCALSERFKVFPSETNFLLIETSPLRSSDFCARLLEKGIVVRDFGGIDGFEGEYARVSIGRPEENDRFLAAVKDI